MREPAPTRLSLLGCFCMGLHNQPAAQRSLAPSCSVHTVRLLRPLHQVARCLDLGIEAALWSSETPEERKKAIARELLADYEDTTLRLLYTTPESLCREELR